jgi:hypothetical protein
LTRPEPLGLEVVQQQRSLARALIQVGLAVGVQGADQFSVDLADRQAGLVDLQLLLCFLGDLPGCLLARALGVQPVGQAPLHDFCFG